MTTTITLYRWQSLGDAVDDIRRHAEHLRAGGWEMARNGRKLNLWRLSFAVAEIADSTK